LAEGDGGERRKDSESAISQPSRTAPSIQARHDAQPAAVKSGSSYSKHRE